MMSRLSSLLVLVSLLSCVALAEKLPVSVYYEALCPDSVKFLTNQLNPSYESLKAHIDVSFVPFGKAISYDNGARFECQHGPPECRENMIQSCSLYSLNGQADKKMEYVACQMNTTVDHTGKTCAAKLSIPWSEVERCMTGGLGVQLQLEAERQTHEVRVPYPEGIPTVTFNNIYNYTQWQEALEDFPKVVCSLIDNAAAICQTDSNDIFNF